MREKTQCAVKSLVQAVYSVDKNA